MNRFKLGGKHAKECGYSRYVGEELALTGEEKEATYGGKTYKLKVATIRVKDVPFPVQLLVHPEDVIYG